MPKRLKPFYRWALCSYGSTRAAALIRIGLALLIWARWADEMVLLRATDTAAIFCSVGFFLTSTLMLAGYWSQVTSLATGLLLLVLYILRPSWQHHHTYLLIISTILVALTPCGRSYAVDRWLALRRAKRQGAAAPREEGNLWGMRLIALQVSLLYFWTAYDKLYWGFLSGARMQHYFYFHYPGFDYRSIPGFDALCFLVSIVTVVLEFLLSFGLFIGRLRCYLIPAGIVLHGLFYVLLPIETFTLTILLLYLAFLPADAFHSGIDAIQGNAR